MRADLDFWRTGIGGGSPKARLEACHDTVQLPLCADLQMALDPLFSVLLSRGEKLPLTACTRLRVLFGALMVILQ